MRLECFTFQKPAIGLLDHLSTEELLPDFSFPFKCSLLNRRKKAACPLQVPCVRRAVCPFALMKLKDTGRALFILLDSLQRLSAPRSFKHQKWLVGIIWPGPGRGRLLCTWPSRTKHRGRKCRRLKPFCEVPHLRVFAANATPIGT